MVTTGGGIIDTYPEAASVLQGVGMMYLEMHDKERESVLSAARTQTRFLRSPSLRAVLDRSSLRLEQIKREPTTVYLCLPVRRMASHARWLRIVINLCLQSFEDDYKPKIPVLMVLDEFNVLGHMQSIETAAGQLAGFGVKLWTVLQDIGQVRKLYRDGWETFVGNAGVVTFFGNTDHFTLDYIAKKLGSRTFLIERPEEGSPGARYSGAPLMKRELRQEPLLAAHEIADFLGRDKQSILVMTADKKPVILQRALYHDPKDRFYKLAHGA
jgi:type IV secretion system protein VirD4